MGCELDESFGIRQTSSDVKRYYSAYKTIILLVACTEEEGD